MEADEEQMERILLCDSPWVANAHGLWCPHCGDCIAPPWFFDREDFTPKEQCRCGFPDFD